MKPNYLSAFAAFLGLIGLALFAADPEQPKIGSTPVLNATNGFAGVLTVRTQLNVGSTGQAIVTSNGSLSLSGATNVLTIAGGQLLLDGSPIGGGSGDTIWTNANGTISATSTNKVLVNQINGWFNVMAYGATGNGSTDDTAAIQLAINACDNADGGTVYFPNGTYKIGTGMTNALIVANANLSHGGQHYVSLLGQSAVSTVLSFVGATNGAAVVFSADAFVSLQTMYIKRSGAQGSTTGLLLTGPGSGTQTYGGYVRNVIFNGWYICINSSPNGSPVDYGYPNGTSSEMVFDSVVFQSSTIGFFNYNFNGLNFMFRMLMADSVGIVVDGKTAGITIDGGSFSSCGVGLFAENGGLFSIKNVRAETQTGYFLEAGPTTVVMENCSVQVANTNVASIHLNDTYTTIDRCSFGSKIVCDYGSIDIQNTGVFDTVIFQGNGQQRRINAFHNYQVSGNGSEGMTSWLPDNCQVNGILHLRPSGGGSSDLGESITNSVILKQSTTNVLVRLSDDSAYSGIATAGVSSFATDTAVTIDATGWTNTFGKNAVVYLDGVGLTFKVANNAGTFVYTNNTALGGDSIILQPSGKLIITAGTSVNGRATPF